MLKLGNPESGWRDVVPGVRFRFLPITIKSVRAARRACGLALRSDKDDFQEASDALTRELLRAGVAEWDGIGDINGEPVAPTTMLPILDAAGDPVIGADEVPVMEPAIEQALRNVDLFEAAERIYVRPWLERDREGNGSAGSSNGTSGAETPAINTATSPVPSAKPASDAKPTPKKARKPARTGRTSRRPRLPS